MLWCSFIEYAYSNLPLQMVKNITPSNLPITGASKRWTFNFVGYGLFVMELIFCMHKNETDS